MQSILNEYRHPCKGETAWLYAHIIWVGCENLT